MTRTQAEVNINQEQNDKNYKYHAYFCEAYQFMPEVTRIGQASNPGPKDDRRNTPSRSPP